MVAAGKRSATRGHKRGLNPSLGAAVLQKIGSELGLAAQGVQDFSFSFVFWRRSRQAWRLYCCRALFVGRYSF